MPGGVIRSAARIGEHQGVGFMLADNEIDLHLSRLAIWHAAWLLDQHEQARNETSMSKVFCSEALGRVVDRSLQILGSIGITRDTVVERIYRDIRPFRIYDGPSEVHRHALARRILSRNGPQRITGDEPMASGPTYEELYASFRWNIPARYNIATDVCDRHAGGPGKIALIGEGADGKIWRMTFREVQRKANQLANLLVSLGLVNGDRVMLLLGQNAWTAIGHVACWKAGFVSVPAVDPVRLRTRSPIALITSASASSSPIWTISPRLRRRGRWRRQLSTCFSSMARAPEARASLEELIEAARDTFANVDTAADDPAFLNFTSGTTGNPKGALQAHRSHAWTSAGRRVGLDFFPQPGDCMWSPADWAWLAGLMDVLMPAWYPRRSGLDVPGAALRSRAGVRDDWPPSGSHRDCSHRRCSG